MKPKESALRDSYERLRDACDTFEERLLLGQAIQRGWTATLIEREAKRYKVPRRIKDRRRQAVYDTSRRDYMSPEETAKIWADMEAIDAANAARNAILATKATRPAIPSPAYAPIRAACRSMLDVDRFQCALDAGWKAEDILYLARVHSEVSVHRRLVESPGAIRFALSLIEGHPAGQYYSWLPRPNQTTPL